MQLFFRSKKTNDKKKANETSSCRDVVVGKNSPLCADLLRTQSDMEAVKKELDSMLNPGAVTVDVPSQSASVTRPGCARVS